MTERTGLSSEINSTQEIQQIAWTGAVTLVLFFLAFQNLSKGIQNSEIASAAPRVRNAAGIAAVGRAPDSTRKELLKEDAGKMRFNAEPVMIYRYSEPPSP